jgi:hypothetical protein
MDFVTLDAALTSMANCIPVPFYHQYAEEAFRFSEAARILHQTLKNHPESRPLWVECFGGRRPLHNDDVSDHGMKVLLHAKCWYDWESKSLSDHAFMCSQANLDPKTEPRLLDDSKDKYPRELIMRPFYIGFDRAELIAFLDRNRIEHTLESQTSIVDDTIQPNNEPVEYDGVDFIVNNTPQPNELREWYDKQIKPVQELKIAIEAAHDVSQAKAVTNDCSKTTGKPDKLTVIEEQRLKAIKEYIDFLDKASIEKRVAFDRFDLPITKIIVLRELKKRSNIFKIKIDAFKLVWRLATKEKICANPRATTAKGEKFLESIFKV